MTTSMICASHSPLLYCYAKEPDDWEDMQKAFATRERAAQGSTGRAPVDRIPADFPPLARRAGIEGFAVVEFGP